MAACPNARWWSTRRSTTPWRRTSPPLRNARRKRIDRQRRDNKDQHNGTEEHKRKPQLHTHARLRHTPPRAHSEPSLFRPPPVGFWGRQVFDAHPVAVAAT